MNKEALNLFKEALGEIAVGVQELVKADAAVIAAQEAQLEKLAEAPREVVREVRTYGINDSGLVRATVDSLVKAGTLDALEKEAAEESLSSDPVFALKLIQKLASAYDTEKRRVKPAGRGVPAAEHEKTASADADTEYREKLAQLRSQLP